jgi:hypothetical protein
MSDELHRLAFEYRNARTYVDTARAYAALEAHEKRLLDTINTLVQRNFAKLVDVADNCLDERCQNPAECAFNGACMYACDKS